MNQKNYKNQNNEPTHYTVGEFNGKMPPNAKELEEVVLGACLLEKEALETISEILTPQSFYELKNSLIFEACLSLKNRNESVDILSVTQELKRTSKIENVGGAFYISSLTNRIASSANIEYHARIVQQKFLQRELIRISSETITSAYEDDIDVFELKDEVSVKINSIDEKIGANKFIYAHNAAIENVKLVKDVMSGKVIQGVYSGFPIQQRTIGGWVKSEHIIIAARPGVGKTSLALQYALKPSEKEIPVAFFSLEMGITPIITRVQSLISQVPAERITKGTMSNDEFKRFESTVDYLKNIPLYFDETPSLSLPELRRKSRKLVRDKKVELIIIDYLQLMRSGRHNLIREQEISQISEGLKALAKELNIPVIALSQLSREVEKRSDKRPMLSDIRESGSLEANADVVIFIYRDEYYGILTDVNNNSTIGKAEIIIAKNRNGAVQTIDLNFDAACTRFYDPHEAQVIFNDSKTDFKSLQANDTFLEDKPF